MFRLRIQQALAGLTGQRGAVATAAAGSLYVWIFCRLLDLSYGKAFSMDELGFMHAGWMTARGYEVFKDFVLLFIGVGQVSAIPALLSADNSDTLLAMRLFQMAFIVLMAVAGWRITREAGPVAGAVAFALSFSIWRFTQYMVEVRPDSIAFPLFLASLAALYETKLTGIVRGGLCGALYAAAAWMTPKAFICGWVFFAAIAVDAALRKKNFRDYVVHPGGFLAGAGATTAAIAVALWLEGSLSGLWNVTLPHAVDHERMYPTVSWQKRLLWFFRAQPWIPLLAAVSAAGIVRTEWIRRRRRLSPDAILVGAVVTTFLSYVLQKGALSYSWLPLVGVVGVLAGRGLFQTAAALNKAVWIPPFGRAALAAALVIIVAAKAGRQTSQAVRGLLDQRPNEHQLAVIESVCRLTWVTDAWYDNSASYVVRPNAARFYFTDKVMRRTRYSEMQWDVPKELIDKQCKGWVHDRRYEELPWALQGFMKENFVPFDDDLRLWGRRYDPTDGLMTERRFTAIEDGWYFISPPSAVQSNKIRIDGRPVTDVKFRLKRGKYKVSYRAGDAPFYVLWLPRDGRQYAPKKNPRPRFHRLTSPL